MGEIDSRRIREGKIQSEIQRKRPTGLNGHLSMRLYTDFLSDVLILVYQQSNHRINGNQPGYRKAAS